MPDFLEYDERMIAFEYGFQVYQFLWETLKVMREQVPSAYEIFMWHQYDPPQEEAWYDRVTFTGEDEEVITFALSWFRDPLTLEVDFNLFISAHFLAKELVDIRSLCLKHKIPYLLLGKEEELAQLMQDLGTIKTVKARKELIIL